MSETSRPSLLTLWEQLSKLSVAEVRERLDCIDDERRVLIKLLRLVRAKERTLEIVEGKEDESCEK